MSGTHTTLSQISFTKFGNEFLIGPLRVGPNLLDHKFTFSYSNICLSAIFTSVSCIWFPSTSLVLLTMVQVTIACWLLTVHLQTFLVVVHHWLSCFLLVAAFKGPILYSFSSISHSCQMSNNTAFEMHCPKPICGPEFQLSKSRSIELCTERHS